MNSNATDVTLTDWLKPCWTPWTKPLAGQREQFLAHTVGHGDMARLIAELPASLPACQHQLTCHYNIHWGQRLRCILFLRHQSQTCTAYCQAHCNTMG
jgi:hypothetical protein